MIFHSLFEAPCGGEWCACQVRGSSVPILQNPMLVRDELTAPCARDRRTAKARSTTTLLTRGPLLRTVHRGLDRGTATVRGSLVRIPRLRRLDGWGRGAEFLRPELLRALALPGWPEGRSAA